jgi:hypothetical protein
VKPIIGDPKLPEQWWWGRKKNKTKNKGPEIEKKFKKSSNAIGATKPGPEFHHPIVPETHHLEIEILLQKKTWQTIPRKSASRRTRATSRR